MMSYLWLILYLAIYVEPGYAGEVYKWQDASGIVHFTDSLSKVPVKYRKNKPLIMKDSLFDVRGSEKSKEGFSKPEGAKIWDEKCAECHHLGFGQMTGLKGLAYLAVNPMTKFPARVEDIFPDLKYAVSGRTSDMPEVDVSDAGLRALARYIIESNY